MGFQPTIKAVAATRPAQAALPEQAHATATLAAEGQERAPQSRPDHPGQNPPPATNGRAH